jgi:hypothetical protein
MEFWTSNRTLRVPVSTNLFNKRSLKMANNLFRAMAGLVLLTLVSTTSQADTIWSTSYRSLGGAVLNSNVTLDFSGTRGTYSTYDNNGNYLGGGSLTNVRYENFGGQPLLRGNWSWNGGGSGGFTWRMNPTLDQFSGSYSAGNGGGGFWNGRYTSGSGAAGGGGPLISP